MGQYGQLHYTRKSRNEDEAGFDVATRSRRRRAPATVKEVPGLSPAAYLLFWYVTVFSELAEIFPELPAYRDVVNQVDLDNTHVTIWRVPQLDAEGHPMINQTTGEEIIEEK